MGTAVCEKASAFICKKLEQIIRGNEKAIISGTENKQLSWTPRQTINEVERMDQMEDLKISRHCQGERNFISFQ